MDMRKVGPYITERPPSRPSRMAESTDVFSSPKPNHHATLRILDNTTHYTFETRQRSLLSAIWTIRGGTGRHVTVGKNSQERVAVIYTGNCLLHRLYEPATTSMSHESARSNAYSATPHTGSRVRRHERNSRLVKGQEILVLKTTEQHKAYCIKQNVN